ncbi:hypothetical protein V2S66_31440 [Streptomyces sp. V4-01]|uniref:Uncharacterized protein n=1 Tax=Actinacidiphila polyblastidii TaxID=3110430 RepID=A0ABU7PKV5_9ACTN|nr:hypothetical protein [Streptomyces sp. V4-01]
MAAWICRDCTATYSVGAPQCPQCGSTDRIEEEEQNMPKITVAGGPSIAGVTGGWSDHDAEDQWPAQNADQDEEGGEESSPSSSSSPSETKRSSEPETTSSGSSKRARTTASRGKQARTAGSTAHSTDTDQTAHTSETDSDED